MKNKSTSKKNFFTWNKEEITEDEREQNKDRLTKEDKVELLRDALKGCPKEIEDFFKQCELIGLNERVTYHKMPEKEDVPYTHIFDNPTILLKFKKYPMLIIYGPKLRYVNKFIEDD